MFGWFFDQCSPVTVRFREENHPVASLRRIDIKHVTAPRWGGDMDTQLLQMERLNAQASSRHINQEYDI